MKKTFSKVMLACALIAFSFNSCDKNETTPTPSDNNPPVEEFLAPTTPQTKTAVLEDFTGVRCVFCPDGHDRANAIESAYPNRFIIIATHAGGYANPSNGWHNFTTPFGDAILQQAKVTGFPSGTISRMPAEDLGAQPMMAGGMGMGRGFWSDAAEMQMGMPAPVNLGAKATFDAATRKLTVKVDIYYTKDETVPNNLNIALLQDKVVSKQITPQKQSGDPNYIQNNVLRHYLTGQWGEVITEPTTTGSKVTKTFVYDVPADYNGTGPNGGGAVVAEDLEIVAFITHGKKEILNAVRADVTVK